MAAVGALVGVGVEVAPQPFLKGVRADVALDLPQDAAALVVDDGGGAGVDDEVGAARDLDRIVFEQPVARHGGGGRAVQELLPDLPFRVIVRNDAVAEIGREAFVQPEVVPVRRGDQVAEPLVGDFVRDDLADALLAGPGGDVRVMQQQVLPEGDGAPVLHGPEGEVRHGDQVHLGQGIGDAVVGLAELQRLAAELQAVAGELLLAGQRQHAHPAVDVILERLEGAHPEEDEVGGHLRRALEDHALLAVFQDLLGLDLGVRHGREAAVDLELDVENGLLRRVVQAGKSAAGVALLELGHGDVLRPSVAGVAAAVEACHAVVDFPGIVDLDPDLPGHGLRQNDAELFRRGVHSERAGRNPVRTLEAAAPDRKLDGVQHNLRDRLRCFELDVHAAVKGEADQIGDQADAVVQRNQIRHTTSL